MLKLVLIKTPKRVVVDEEDVAMLITKKMQTNLSLLLLKIRSHLIPQKTAITTINTGVKMAAEDVAGMVDLVTHPTQTSTGANVKIRNITNTTVV